MAHAYMDYVVKESENSNPNSNRAAGASSMEEKEENKKTSKYSNKFIDLKFVLHTYLI